MVTNTFSPVRDIFVLVGETQEGPRLTIRTGVSVGECIADDIIDKGFFDVTTEYHLYWIAETRLLLKDCIRPVFALS